MTAHMSFEDEHIFSNSMARILTNWLLAVKRKSPPPSLLMIGNNYLKQLAFDARANSPVPICRATRDHEPRRGEGSALPIRLGLAATRLETSAFALCATAESRRCRLVPAAHLGFFAAPGHEMPPSRHTKRHETFLTGKPPSW